MVRVLSKVLEKQSSVVVLPLHNFAICCAKGGLDDHEAETSPGSLLMMKNLRFHPRSAELQLNFLGVPYRFHICIMNSYDTLMRKFNPVKEVMHRHMKQNLSMLR